MHITSSLSIVIYSPSDLLPRTTCAHVHALVHAHVHGHMGVNVSTAVTNRYGPLWALQFGLVLGCYFAVFHVRSKVRNAVSAFHTRPHYVASCSWFVVEIRTPIHHARFARSRYSSGYHNLRCSIVIIIIIVFIFITSIIIIIICLVQYVRVRYVCSCLHQAVQSECGYGWRR